MLGVAAGEDRNQFSDDSLADKLHYVIFCKAMFGGPVIRA